MALITADLRGASIVGTARQAVEVSIEPLRGVVAAGRRALPTWDRADSVRRERDRLRAELLDRDADAARRALAEDQLRSVLAAQDLPWVGDLERTLARVTSGPRSNLSRTLEIDQGTDDGLHAGMPVVSGAGLVGRLARVARSTSIVELITDPAVRVGVKLVPEGPFGTARGAGDGLRLTIDSSLPAGEAAPVGLMAVTSGGSDSPYPPGIPVGMVRGGATAANGLTVDLLAEASAPVSTLDFVTVLRWDGSR